MSALSLAWTGRTAGRDPGTLQGSRSQTPGSREQQDLATARSTRWDATMEHITVAGHPEPIPTSAKAAELLQDRLDSARQKAGPDGAAEVEAYEKKIGERIGMLLKGGMPSIDLATMRSITDYVNIPDEPEEPESGLGRVLRGIRSVLPEREHREERFDD